MEVWEKSSTVDPEVRAYVYSLVNAVGGRSSYDDTYSVGDDALAALTDLTRWLRLYDEKLNRFDVKRCLAESNLVKGDLLEILALWSENAPENKLKAKLALACLQLLVPLTWPLELEDEKTTINHHRHLPYLQLAQVSYKRAILHFEHAAILRTALRVALPSMAQPRRERSKRDDGIIKLVLYLFRNLTMITQPQMLPSQGDENEISRSSTIDIFHQQDIFTLLLTIGSGSNDEFQDHDVILLEILFHMVKGVDSTKLFMEEKQVQNHEADELRVLMQKERAMHKSYNKQAPSRHNRFGTMIWVKREDQKVSTVTGQTSITNSNATLQVMDASKKWNKPRHLGRAANFDVAEQTAIAERVELSQKARTHLRDFVSDFLDSSFNPMFANLRKAIEREHERIGKSHERQYFYLMAWFLEAERARRKQSAATGTQNDDNTFAYIAAVLDQETFVLLSRCMQRYFDEKSWADLQATLRAFTQILLTVQVMSESQDEDDQEIAENIQNRIFYEERTHDLIIQILRGYSNQGFSYLDTVTETAHVFVRMLERYSRQNADMHIRSKRRARRKAKNTQQGRNGTSAEGANEEDAAEEAEDEREAQVTVTERKFDFARFSAKFVTQPCLNTFVALLHYHEDLNTDQLKRCHRFLYRLAFKHELIILLFRVDILLLLYRMIKGPGGLSSELEGYKDWEQLVRQVFRKCIKWMEKENEGAAGEGVYGWKEMCVVEMLFSKVPSTVFYLQNGYERVVEKRPPKAPAELEFKGTVEEAMKIPIAVSLLLEHGKADTIDWLKKELQRAVEERTAWEQERSARAAANEESDVLPTGDVAMAPPVFVTPDHDDRKMQLFKDKHLRLLLATVGLHRLGLTEDIDASWIVPPETSSTAIEGILNGIRNAEFNPPTFDDATTAADLIRKKSTARREVNTYPETEDSESGGDLDEAMFPPNLRESRKDSAERPSKRRRLTKRNQKELTEAELEERAVERRRKEKERNGKIKSSLFVTASDDESDSEGDSEFFRLEEERREKMKGVIRSALLQQAEEEEEEEEAQSGRKKTGKAKRKKQAVDVEPDQGNDFSSDEERQAPKRPRTKLFEETDASDAESSEFEIRRPTTRDRATEGVTSSDFDHDVDPAGTPSTSPNDGMLTERSVNIGTAKPAALLPEQGSGDEDDAVPVKATIRRNIRAGFIIDDDSDED